MADPIVDVRIELQRLAQAASGQGRVRVEAICLLAIAKIDELEAEVTLRRASAQRSAQARAQHLTAEERSHIATVAAKRRWHSPA